MAEGWSGNGIVLILDREIEAIVLVDALDHYLTHVLGKTEPMSAVKESIATELSLILDQGD